MDYLKHIFAEDIELLLLDLKLLKMGYEIDYIIDPSDIISYSFPYGFKFNMLDSKHANDVSDELIAYEYIFQYKHPILLDEYHLELIVNRNQVKESNDKRFNQDLFTLLLKDKNIGKEELLTLLTNNSKFLVATGLMLKSFMEKFDDVYNNRLQTTELKGNNGNRADLKILKDIYNEVKRSNWSKEAFDRWARRALEDKGRKKDHDKYDDNDKHEILSHLKSTYRDFIVIDRICRINERIQQSTTLTSKYLYLYFSGAPKSVGIFESEDIRQHQPVIEGLENYSLLRTPKHSYLWFLVFEDDYEKQEETLLRLKEIAFRKESNFSLADSLEKNKKNGSLWESLKVIEKRRQDLMERSLLSYQIKNHNKLRKKLERKVQLLRKQEKMSDVVKIYEEFIKNALNATEDIAITQLDISYAVQGGLLNLMKLMQNDNFSVKKGRDLIQGTYHHLPILLLFDNKSRIDELKESLLKEVIEYVIMSPERRRKVLSNFLESLGNLYKKLEQENAPTEKYYDMLVKYFLYMVLDTSGNDQSAAINSLKDARVLLGNNSDAYERWNDDYYYLLIWALRRNNNISESKELSLEAIEEYPEDPRFYHGYCIAYYNEITDEDTLRACNKKELKEIVDCSEKSLQLYQNILQDNTNYYEGFKAYIEGNIDALCNLLLYVISLYLLREMEQNKDIDSKLFDKYDLPYLRNVLLARLREDSDEKKEKSKELPEYLHTESVLELVEAIYNFHKQIPSDKIKRSLEAVESALSRDPESKLFKNTKAKILVWENIIDINASYEVFEE